MKHSKTLLAAALGLLVASSLPAQADSHGDKVNNYVKDYDSAVVTDSNGDCVRTYDMTDERLEECGYASMEVVVEKAPEAWLQLLLSNLATVLESRRDRTTFSLLSIAQY